MNWILNNWKSTAAGLVILITQVLPLVGVPLSQELVNTITTVAAALGLIVAKDGNVTGVK
jgi:hypothetical protein